MERTLITGADAPADGSHRFQGAIFDVDGVLVDSPHYRAWRDALQELMGTEWTDVRSRTSYAPEKFTEAVYQQVVAGRPRLAGARAALEYFGVPDAGRRAELLAAVKQEHLVTLIEAGEFPPSPTRSVSSSRPGRPASRSPPRPPPRTPTYSCGRYGSIPMSPSRTSPCLTCWTRTSPGATCRGASPIRRSSWSRPRSSAPRPPGASWSRTPWRACRRPRPATWPLSAWPASAIPDCWPTRARTWSYGRSMRYPARLWPKACSSGSQIQRPDGESRGPNGHLRHHRRPGPPDDLPRPIPPGAPRAARRPGHRGGQRGHDHRGTRQARPRGHRRGRPGRRRRGLRPARPPDVLPAR